MISIIKKTSILKNICSPNVQKKMIADRECIYLKFKGVLRKSSVKSALIRIKSIMLDEPNKKHVMVWNCTEILDYDTEARNIIQDALNESKDKIESIWVITNSLALHAAVEIISFFSSTRIRVVKTEDQLQ